MQRNCVPGVVDRGTRQLRFSRDTRGFHSNVDDLGDALWIGVAVQPRMLTIELFTKAWRESDGDLVRLADVTNVGGTIKLHRVRSESLR